MFKKANSGRPMTIDDKAGYVLQILACHLAVFLVVLGCLIGATVWLFKSDIPYVPWIVLTLSIAWFMIPVYLVMDMRK